MGGVKWPIRIKKRDQEICSFDLSFVVERGGGGIGTIESLSVDGLSVVRLRVGPPIGRQSPNKQK